MSFYKNTGAEIVHPHEGQVLKPGQIVCIDVHEMRPLTDSDLYRECGKRYSYAEAAERYFSRGSVRYFKVIEVELAFRGSASFCSNCPFQIEGDYCLRGLFPGSSCEELPERDGKCFHTTFEEIEL